jgi:hypothetical protein
MPTTVLDRELGETPTATRIVQREEVRPAQAEARARVRAATPRRDPDRPSYLNVAFALLAIAALLAVLVVATVAPAAHAAKLGGLGSHARADR